MLITGLRLSFNPGREKNKERRAEEGRKKSVRIQTVKGKRRGQTCDPETERRRGKTAAETYWTLLCVD